MGWSTASQTEGHLQKVTFLRCYTASLTNFGDRNTPFPLFRYHEDTGIYILKRKLSLKKRTNASLQI